MDLTAAAEDIAELIGEFAAVEGTAWTQMKKLWSDKSFSFIHESRPKDVNGSFFIQGLFSCALRHITEGASLSWRLGGLYVLHALHGTQPENPPWRIYLSLEELESLNALVKELLEKRLNSPFELVKQMVTKNVFMYGSVSANQKRIADSMAELIRKTNARVQRARKELFEKVPIENYLNAERGQELGLDELSGVVNQYNIARKKAFSIHSGDQAHGSGVAEVTIARDLRVDVQTLKTNLLALARNEGGALNSGVNTANAGSQCAMELDDDESLLDFERELLQELDSE